MATDDIFSSEYSQSRATSAEKLPQASSTSMDIVNIEHELVQEEVKRYGLGKPKREVIRAHRL